jgi:hypothetical protein
MDRTMDFLTGKAAMTRILPLVFCLSLIAGAGARGQEAISTAANSPDGGAPGAAASGAGPILLSDKSSDFDDRGPIMVGPCGGVAKSVDGGPLKPDKNPHGEVWGGVGTHGYREAGGALCVPLGQNAQVSVAVDTVRWGRR